RIHRELARIGSSRRDTRLGHQTFVAQTAAAGVSNEGRQGTWRVRGKIPVGGLSSSGCMTAAAIRLQGSVNALIRTRRAARPRLRLDEIRRNGGRTARGKMADTIG